MHFKHLLATTLSIFLALTYSASAERRVALVIGNQAYENTAHLANPKNDATAMADKLTSIGFEVSLHTDLTGQGFRIALGQFTEKALTSDLAMVFYAGHGIEMNGKNYLIPVDARMQSEATAQFEAISLDGVLSTIRQTGKLGMVLLDACRDNPFANTMKRTNGTRSASRGLANVSLEQESGILVSFAAQAGSTADDGKGMHSPYTTALLEVLDSPGLEVGRMFRRVRANVKAQTDGKQIPIERMQLPDEEIYLVPPTGNASSTPNTNTQKPKSTTTGGPDPFVEYLAAVNSRQRAPLEQFISKHPNHANAADARGLLQRMADDEFWEQTNSQGTAQAYETYLLAFSDGRYRSQAETRLLALQKPEPIPVPRVLPSFDCAKAQTPVERAICSDNDLARQDQELLAAYNQALSSGRTNKQAQRNWIKQREASCAGMGSGIIECVANFAAQRILALNPPANTAMTGIRQSCPALSGAWGVSRVQSNDTLFVRSGPGKGYPVVGELPYTGNRMTVSNCTGDNWCAIQFGCISGYSHGGYLSQSFQGAGPFSGNYSVTDHPMNEKLNVRAGPGTNYLVIAELPPNATGVHVWDCQIEDGYKYRWCHMNWGQITGWAYGRYLSNERGEKPMPQMVAAPQSCHNLWIARNSIFHQQGYCFGSAKAKQYFSNDRCTTTTPTLSADQKRQVQAIQAQEAAQGC